MNMRRFSVWMGILGLMLLAGPGCNKMDVAALKKPGSSTGRQSAMQGPPKPPAVAVLGFSAETDPGDRIWVGYGLSYFVADKLRLDSSRIVIDPTITQDLMPEVDTRLMTREPARPVLDKLKNLLDVEAVTFVTYRIAAGQLSIRAHTLTGGGEEERTFTGSLGDVSRLDVELTRYLAAKLHAEKAPGGPDSRPVIGATLPGGKPFQLDEADLSKMTPGNATAYQQAALGTFYSSILWNKESARHFESAVKSDPAYLNAYISLAEIYILESDNEKVLATLERPTRVSPDDFYVWYLLGKAYLDMEKVDDARRALEKSRSLNPGFPATNQALSIVYDNLKERQKGKEALYTFLQSNPMTGSEIRRARQYLSAFKMRPETREVSGALKALQGRPHNFFSPMAALGRRVEYVTEWFVGKSQRGIFLPYDILRDPQTGDFYVVEQLERQLLVLSPGGKVTNAIPLGDTMIMPFRVSAYEGKTLLVTDGLGQRIFALDPEKKTTREFSSSILKPTGILSIRNAVYVLDSKHYQLSALDPNGKPVAQARLPSYLTTKSLEPSGIALGPDGLLYVTDSLQNLILVLMKDGKVVRQIGGTGAGPGEFQQPSGIAVDPQGRIYVTDAYNGRVQVLDAQGNPIGVFGTPGGGYGQFSNPSGIATDGKGTIYVADTGNGRIQVLKLK